MHTLLSIFDDAGAARAARDRLEQSGIHRDNLHLEEGKAPPAFSQQDPDDSIEGFTSSGDSVVDRGVLPSIGHVVASMFGLDHRDASGRAYSDAVRSGKSVLIADTESAEKAATAHGMLRKHGANASNTRIMPRVTKTPLKDLVARIQYAELTN